MTATHEERKKKKKGCFPKFRFRRVGSLDWEKAEAGLTVGKHTRVSVSSGGESGGKGEEKKRVRQNNWDLVKITKACESRLSTAVAK